jgi:MFS family permease
LIVTQAAAMMIAFVLAILIGTGQVQVWHLYITSVLLGIVAALDMPAQQAFLGDLSGMAEVRKAVLLNSMIFQTSRMIGPALAGLIIGTLGAAVAFWLNGFSFLAVIASLLLVRTNQVRASRLTNTWNGFREGMRFVGDHPRIQDLLLFAVLVTFLGLPIINIFPAVASQILNGDATTLGWLLAASGAGALVGVVFVLPITNSLQRTGLVIGSAVVWTGAWFMVFSLSTQLLTSMLSVFLVGLGVPSVMTAAMGLLQVSAPMDMRARLVSLFVIVTFGMQPLASLLVGYGAESLGITTVIRINSLLLMAIPVLMWMFRPHLRQWEVACEADHTAVCI